MTGQIMAGSLILGVCSALHIAVLVLATFFLQWLNSKITCLGEKLGTAFLLGIAFSAVVVGHTIQVWLWAGAFIWVGALPALSDALYFSLVTYTTLGYGDITIGPQSRIFGAMSAVTGLLNFGLSTAFLVETARSPSPSETKKAVDSA
ncbi:MAG: ion channel [Hyphomicrobiaceae bacterium]